MSLVLEQYTTKLTRAGSPDTTLRTWASISTRADRWLRAQGRSSETATMADFEDYFDAQADLSASTKQTHLRYLQAAYSYAIRRGTVRENPVLDVVLAAPEPKIPRTIAPAELRAIRDGITRERDWIWFHLLAFAGLRRSEARGLVWDDGRELGSVLGLEEQTIRVFGKGRKWREVPIHPALGEVLAEHRREPGAFVVPSDGAKGIALETIQDISRRLHPTYTPHDYRRTVATSLDQNGVPEAVIDRIMGWGAQSIFRKYYRGVAGPELQRAILRLYADDPV